MSRCVFVCAPVRSARFASGVRRQVTGALVALCVAGLWPAAARAADQPARQFPRNALRGEITIVQPPLVALNGNEARLAPGARIRGQNNLLVMSGSIVGQRMLVNYTVDPLGLVKDVWILRAEEARNTPWPRTPEQAAEWSFDYGTQTWTRR